MDEAQKLKLASIKGRIEQGEYRIDEAAVADAIVRRLRTRGAPPPASGPTPTYERCS
jgi:anti-sigma-28 factor FlgM